MTPSGRSFSFRYRRAAQALRHAANELSEHYRRLRARLGGGAVITAMANKLVLSC